MQAIHTAATNATVRSSMDTMHRVFVDKGITGQSPMERALASVDYALKESQGIRHVKVSQDVLNMPFYVVHGYDIFLSVAVFSLSVCALVFKLCRRCLL